MEITLHKNLVRKMVMLKKLNFSLIMHNITRNEREHEKIWLRPPEFKIRL